MKHAPKKPCTSTKADGTSCRAAALPGSQFCFFHDPTRAAARRKAQSRGGQAHKMATLPADTPAVKVEDGADVVKLLGVTINQVRRGEIDPRIGNTVGYLSNIVLTATKQCDGQPPPQPETETQANQIDLSKLPIEVLKEYERILEKILALTGTPEMKGQTL
jgi:hypothetical protein